MIKFTKTLALLVLASAAFTACKKDKDDSLAITKENLAGTYTVVSIKEKNNNGAEEDAMDDYFSEACEKDDEWVLKTDMTFERKDAGTTCSSSNNYSNDWQLEQNIVQFDQFLGKVEKLTSSELILKLEVSGGGVSYSETFVFKKK
jgi:hypothetical protein